jgi:hypothetical protein
MSPLHTARVFIINMGHSELFIVKQAPFQSREVVTGEERKLTELKTGAIGMNRG